MSCGGRWSSSSENASNIMSEFPRPTLHDEINPFIVFRVANGQAECATWQLDTGVKALALFLTQESAAAYAADLGPEWKAVRPPRAGLLELLRAGRAGGIAFAVLDPGKEKAKRVFDISEILAAVDGLGPQ